MVVHKIGVPVLVNTKIHSTAHAHKTVRAVRKVGRQAFGECGGTLFFHLPHCAGSLYLLAICIDTAVLDKFPLSTVELFHSDSIHILNAEHPADLLLALIGRISQQSIKILLGKVHRATRCRRLHLLNISRQLSRGTGDSDRGKRRVLEDRTVQLLPKFLRIALHQRHIHALADRLRAYLNRLAGRRIGHTEGVVPFGHGLGTDHGVDRAPLDERHENGK
ncbi:MAG: hypothetical protein IJ009_07100 [Clostridia bacterium]|nr:hypothetical protein [Clostridia bacterium]